MGNRFGFFDGGKEQPKQPEDSGAESGLVRSGGHFGEDPSEDDSEGLLPSERGVGLPEGPDTLEKIATTAEDGSATTEQEEVSWSNEKDGSEAMTTELGEVVAANGDDVETSDKAQEPTTVEEMSAEMDAVVAPAEISQNSAAMIGQIPGGNLADSILGYAAVNALNADQGYSPIGERKENE